MRLFWALACCPRKHFSPCRAAPLVTPLSWSDYVGISECAVVSMVKMLYTLQPRWMILDVHCWWGPAVRFSDTASLPTYSYTHGLFNFAAPAVTCYRAPSASTYTSGPFRRNNIRPWGGGDKQPGGIYCGVSAWELLVSACVPEVWPRPPTRYWVVTEVLMSIVGQSLL